MKLILSSWSSVVLLLLTMLFFPNDMHSCHYQLSNLPLSCSESLERLLCRCQDSWGTAIIDQSLEFHWFADPKYVVAPAIRGPKNHRDIKARVEGEHSPIFVLCIVNLLADFDCTLSLRAIWEAFHCTMQQCTIGRFWNLFSFIYFWSCVDCSMVCTTATKENLLSTCGVLISFIPRSWMDACKALLMLPLLHVNTNFV
jgi:hypothetical protein